MQSNATEYGTSGMQRHGIQTITSNKNEGLTLKEEGCSDNISIIVQKSTQHIYQKCMMID